MRKIDSYQIDSQIPGNTLAIVAGMHGDELSGISFLTDNRSLLKPNTGSLLIIPILNPEGYTNKSRFFGEIDLNHVMPGSDESEAHTHAKIICETLSCADAVVDLHSARVGQKNYPHVRANLDDKSTQELALTQPFPIIHWPATPTTLRGVLFTKDIPTITVEAGEGLKVQYQKELQSLVDGIIAGEQQNPKVYHSRKWCNATTDDDEATVEPGDSVCENDVISKNGIVSPHKGLVIGVYYNPKKGDRLVHIAFNEDTE